MIHKLNLGVLAMESFQDCLMQFLQVLDGENTKKYDALPFQEWNALMHYRMCLYIGSP